MRLLGVNNSYPPVVRGGYGEICADVMEALAERGHDVTMLVCGENYAPLPAGDPPHVQRRLRYVLSPWRRPWAGFGAARDDQAVFRDALAEGVDAVLAWHCRGIAKTSLRLCEEADVPVFYFLHDRWVLYERPGSLLVPWARLDRAGARLPREWAGGLLARRIELRAPHIERRGRVCYVSDWLRGEHLRRGFSPDYDRTVHCGVDRARFARETALADPPTSLLFAGRIEPRKGLHVALDALAREPYPWTLTIAGPLDDPAYETRVREQATRLGIDDRITWRGEVPRDDVRLMLREHDVLLFPSIGVEAYALGLLEALAAGVLVVTSAPGGPREYLVHETNCLLHTADDPDALAAALQRLRTDRELVLRLQAGAADTAEALSLDRVVDQVEGLLSAEVA
ncbi:MAG TPA: glycosyltransferase family 4 protein [Solirubrobacteraceae bacterium]|nr:glycosyltransferase family 4 protein [Solirubrobacteraceae bacterium]